MDQNQKPIQQVGVKSYLPPSVVPKEPQTFQFKVIADIQKHVYERLLGYRVTIKKAVDKNTGKTIKIMDKERVYEPVVTEWGANRIITLIYQFINEQTPFSHISSSTAIKMTNIFCKQLNADIYINFEKYMPKDQRKITMTRLLITTVGFIVLLILSRGIEGRESMMYYQGQHLGLSGVIPNTGAMQ